MDRCQNNGSVKAVSPRHCPATGALRNCRFNCCAWTESQRQCPLHCCWRTTWTTRSKRSPTYAAQLHLPAHDLFWANLKVQLHLPPLRSLDLLISPGNLSLETMYRSFILPQLDYTDASWDNSSLKLSDDLESLHLDAGRTIIGVFRWISHRKLYTESGFTTLRLRKILKQTSEVLNVHINHKAY